MTYQSKCACGKLVAFYGSRGGDLQVHDENGLHSCPVKQPCISVTFNIHQARALLDMFGGEDASIVVDQDGSRLIAWHEDYPGEGCVVLDEDATTGGQGS